MAGTSTRVPGPQTPAWTSVAAAAQRLQPVRIAELLAADPRRFESCSREACGLLLDFSRQKLDPAALEDLYALADAVDLRGAIDQMFAGEPVNVTERRAALHVALRQPRGAAIGGAEIERTVMAERARVLQFAEAVRGGTVRGSGGQAFATVINIGIGGSDLGPTMVIDALRHHAQGGPAVHCVSNVDGCALADVLATADPARTLFIIASKTFTTQETMANARTARAWLAGALGDAAVPAHFAAVSVNAAAMNEFGVHPDYRFAMWDWVGGRYSVWSAIGLVAAIAIGRRHFEALLEGGHAMDRHFRESPWVSNLPVLMALIGVWNINFQRLPTLAVLPYDSRLARFPAYLQQLEMESNGKGTTVGGARVSWDTAPVIWGEPGNNAQHSFFQLLHQGTLRAASDFLLGATSSADLPDHQQLAIANCVAQLEAFALGREAASTEPYRAYPGDRPSSLLLFRALDPRTLGALVALYEHKVYAQSVIWGINAFDQWGVEYGKQICEGLVPVVRGQASAESQPARLRSLLAQVARLRSGPEHS